MDCRKNSVNGGEALIINDRKTSMAGKELKVEGHGSSWRSYSRESWET